MKEKKYPMKNCPSCLREIPVFWDSCYFCGNIFRKSEHSLEGPSMLVWSKKTLNLDRNTLFISNESIEKSRKFREKVVRKAIEADR